MRELIRPQPFRGDVIAAGVVALATLVYLLNGRFGSEWSTGVHLAYTGAAAAFVGAMAVLSPAEGDEPRTYQSILIVATFALALGTLFNLADVLGSDEVTSSGTLVWVASVLALLMAAFAVGRNSAVSTLIAAVTAGVAVLAFVDWAFDPDKVTTFRWTLVLLTFAYAIGATLLRDRRRRHAVQFVNSAGIAVVVMALTFAFQALFGLIAGIFGIAEGSLDVGWGWELYVLAAGSGLIAYAAVDHEPAPGYWGVVALLAFTLMAGGLGEDEPSFVGWPLVLAAAAAGALWIGLRPSRPLPPEPGAHEPPPPATSLRAGDEA